MTSTIIHRIEQKIGSLSRAEARVGRWIADYPQKAIDASIGEVSAESSVSQPTVIRFCRSMGVSGFRELKTHLISARQRSESYLHHDVDGEDKPADAAIKVLESSVRTLVDLRDLITGMPFDKAIDAMARARQIIFVGLGASGIVAQDACHKFFRLGLPCSTALDPQTILQCSAIAELSDVYVATSHTGTWPDMVEALEIARSRGATVIALTDPNSPLAQVASLVFDCHPPEDTNVFTPMSSRLAQLALLDGLQVALALALGEKAETNLYLTKQVLSRGRHVDLSPAAQREEDK